MFLTLVSCARLALLEGNTTMSLIHQDRLTIIKTGEGFSLNVKPTTTEDSGTYFCLVNNRLEPFGAFQLSIQGKRLEFYLQHCRGDLVAQSGCYCSENI